MGKIPKATHRGELTIGDIKIPCAVLDNGQRVLSEHGITMAILGTRSGAAKRAKSAQQEDGALLPLFLAPNCLKPFINGDFESGPLMPIKYQEGRKITIGYEAAILPIVCDIWLKAREAGVLKPSQYDKAQKAEILMRGLAHIGIIALVDEATGYQAERDRDELHKLLARYLSEERLKWAKMFPDEYYRQLFRLRGWNYSPIDTKRPKIVGKYTNELVYEKLPPHVIDELRRLNPVKNKATYRREGAHFQHLSADIGQPDLRDHLLQLIAVMKASPNWTAFKKNFARAFPGPVEQSELDFDDEE